MWIIDLLAVAAGAAYLAGFVLTLAYNVPRNQRLARISSDDDATAYWATFHRQWSRANVVRTVLCVASVCLGIAALVTGGMMS